MDYADGSGVIAGVFVRKRQRIRGTEGDVVTKERETRRCCVTGLEGARRGPRPRTTSWKREETSPCLRKRGGHLIIFGVLTSIILPSKL